MIDETLFSRCRLDGYSLMLGLSLLGLSLPLAPPLAAEPAAPPVKAYAGLDVSRPAQSVRFAKLPTKQGDRIDQTMLVALAMESTVREGEKTVDSKSRKMQRTQQRTVIVEEVGGGQAMAARVRFQKSERSTDDAKPIVQAVVGKTYLCRRQEKGPLQVSREDGSLPSPEEFKVVSESMASLGYPNPLAEYFGGRTVAVGEKLKLPKEVGAGLLGSDSKLGKVVRLEATLLEVLELQGKRVARLGVDMEAQGEASMQMRLSVQGTIDLEVESCRVLRIELTGPLAMASSIGSHSHTQITQVSGKLSVEMSAIYSAGQKN